MNDETLKTLGYTSRLINQNSPLARDSNRFDSLIFDGRLVDTGLGAGNLKDASVTTNKIAGGAVTQAKLAENSVAGSHIINGAITGVDIAGSAVAGTHIELGAVTQTKIAADSVSGSHLSGSAVVGTHIGPLAITNAKINDYDLAKGTGSFINITNVGTAGTFRANSEFSANGTAGISTVATVIAESALGGTVTHVFTFTYGLLSNYGTS